MKIKRAEMAAKARLEGNEEKAKAWEACDEFVEKMDFVWENIDIYKCKCGHWEVLQTPRKDQVAHTKKHAEENTCTHCTCNWKRK